MRLIVGFLGFLTAAIAVPLAQAPATPAAHPAAQSSKVWIGHYEEYENYLKAAAFQRVEGINLGVTSPHHAFFAPGGLAQGGAWKAIKPGNYDGFYESYKSEIAAYKLDRILELGMVPPTVERTYRGEAGSLQLWVENTRMLKQVLAAKDHADDQETWNVQVSRQRLFDDLTANTDDNQGNQLIDGAWNLILIDHSRAFTDTMVQPFEVGRTATRIDKRFFEKLKALDKATLQRELEPWLPTRGVPVLLARRDAIVKGFEKMAAQRGDAKVFTP